MPGLDCSPNSHAWPNFANFGLVLTCHMGWKLEENLATLVVILRSFGRLPVHQNSKQFVYNVVIEYPFVQTRDVCVVIAKKRIFTMIIFT